MRRFWTDETVARKAEQAGIRPQEWVTQQEGEFEKVTEVRWSASAMAGGWQFDPVDEGVDAPDAADRIMVAQVSEAWRESAKDVTGYVSYWTAKEWLGTVRLMDVMKAVKWLESKGRAVRTVNRMGKGFAFKLKGEQK